MINIEEPPITAQELNEVVRRTFICLEGATRAYVEFPMHVSVNDDEIWAANRVVFETISIKGREDLCCRDALRALRDSVSSYALEDFNGMLLVRKWFTYHDDVLSARVAFYLKAWQDKLRASGVIVKDGFTPVPAKR